MSQLIDLWKAILPVRISKRVLQRSTRPVSSRLEYTCNGLKRAAEVEPDTLSLSHFQAPSSELNAQIHQSATTPMIASNQNYPLQAITDITRVRKQRSTGMFTSLTEFLAAQVPTISLSPMGLSPASPTLQIHQIVQETSHEKVSYTSPSCTRSGKSIDSPIGP